MAGLYYTDIQSSNNCLSNDATVSLWGDPVYLDPPAADPHTIKIPTPRCLPDEGVAGTRKAPSFEEAFRIFVWLWQIHNRSDDDIPITYEWLHQITQLGHVVCFHKYEMVMLRCVDTTFYKSHSDFLAVVGPAFCHGRLASVDSTIVRGMMA